MVLCLFLLTFSSAGCGAAATPAPPQIVRVQISSAASPELPRLYDCASPPLVVSLSDPLSADISVRLGEPDRLDTPAFQIGTDEIFVVANPQPGVSALTIEQVRDVFSGIVTSWTEVGGKDIALEVWVYDSNEDIQHIFNTTVLADRPVSTQAHLAVSLQNMSDMLAQNPGAIGILPGHWKRGTLQKLLGGVSVPVLAITKVEPQGAVKALLQCLQK